MWSFYDPDSADEPFERMGKRSSEVRRILGLGHIGPGTELLLMAHQLPDGVEPHIPTTFDAGTIPYFRPGGMTKPLSGSPDGRPEVVHDPVSGTGLVHTVEGAV
jgi:hypothetical protein